MLVQQLLRGSETANRKNRDIKSIAGLMVSQLSRGFGEKHLSVVQGEYEWVITLYRGDDRHFTNIELRKQVADKRNVYRSVQWETHSKADVPVEHIGAAHDMLQLLVDTVLEE